MKKTLLASLALASLAGPALAWNSAPADPFVGKGFDRISVDLPASRKQAPARENDAASTYDYSRAVDPTNPDGAYNFNITSGYIFMVFEVSPEEVANLEGDVIKSINVMTGANNQTGTTQGLTTGSVFVLRSLEGPYETRMTVKFDPAGFTLNTFELEEPYTITGTEPLYIGYAFKAAGSNGYYGTVDGCPIPSGGSIIGVSTKATNFPTEWSDYSSEIGSFCISATLEGSHKPFDQAQIIGANIPASATMGEPFTYQLQLYNRGYNEISSVGITTTIGEENLASSIELEAPIAVGKAGIVTVEVPAFEKPAAYDLTAVVSKVNGVENIYPGSASGSVACYSEGYPQRVVIEEATGTWCGWCPSGAVLLERLKEKYPDDVIRIAVHNGDRMAVQAYQSFIEDYVPGFPFAVIDRATGVYPTETTVNQSVDNYVNARIAAPAYAMVEVSGEEATDGKAVEAKADIKFALDSNSKHLLSFVVVEDGVGPYEQTNYFAEGQKGHDMPMGEWNSRPVKYSTLYDDVARNIQSYPGFYDAIPDEVVAGEVYTYSVNMSVANVKNSEYRLVALLTNATTGQIINASQVTVQHNVGVAEVDAQAAPVVKVLDGSIMVENAANVAVYSIDGAKISEAAVSVVPAGIYVVVADGRATKVAVK